MDVFANDRLRIALDHLGGLAKAGLYNDGPFFHNDWLVILLVTAAAIVIAAAVDVVPHHSSVGSFQGWGRDGHGRGLLLLLSGTALHLVTYGVRY